jgi:hypothetical protein
MIYQAILFLVGFFIPFFAQLFWIRHIHWVRICNMICILTETFFLILEILQMKKQTWRIYISELQNKVDLVLISFVYFYMAMRLYDPEREILPQTDIKAGVPDKLNPCVEELFFWSIMNTLTLLFATFKMLFFLRISNKFVMLVDLIQQAIIGAIPFMVFFILFLLLITFLYLITGVEVPDGDYPDINEFSMYLF